MNLLPKIKQCPCCAGINLVKINGITYENNFNSLSDWKLKKKFNCRKCKTELGLFVHNSKNIEKVIWFEFFNCEDYYFDELNRLKINRDKFKKQTPKYYSTINAIKNIQNKIRLNQVKIKIKYKIEHRGMLI